MTHRTKLIGLLAAAVLALLLLQGLESLFREEHPNPVDPTAESPAADPLKRPQLERVDARTIRVDAGMIDQTTFRFDEDDDPAEIDAIYACLEAGLVREFDENPTASSREMRRRLRRLNEECLRVAVPDIPPVP